MSPEDVVRVAAGTLVDVELWQSALQEAGIESKVVGTELSSGIGTALPAPIELWVRDSDRMMAELTVQKLIERAATRNQPGDDQTDPTDPGSE